MSTPSASRRGDAKRAAIVAAARKAFLDQGYEAASMDAIAAAATVSKRTVYNHFPSKRDLFRAVITQLYAGLLEGLPDGLPAGQPAAQVLPGFARRVLTHLAQPDIRGVLRLVIAEQHRFPELAQDFHAAGKGPAQALLQTYLTAQAERGTIRAADPALAAALFLGGIKEACYWPSLLGLPVADAEAVIAQATAAFLAAFAVPD